MEIWRFSVWDFLNKKSRVKKKEKLAIKLAIKFVTLPLNHWRSHNIFLHLLVFYQFFLLPQVKRSLVSKKYSCLKSFRMTWMLMLSLLSKMKILPTLVKSFCSYCRSKMGINQTGWGRGRGKGKGEGEGEGGGGGFFCFQTRLLNNTFHHSRVI